MTRLELVEQVASATGETVDEIRRRGFSIADPLEVTFDPEPRPPLVFDWDSRGPAFWPGF